MSIVSQLRKARRNLEISQEDLGKKVKLTKSRVCIIESGAVNTGYKTLEKIAKQLGGEIVFVENTKI